MQNFHIQLLVCNVHVQFKSYIHYLYSMESFSVTKITIEYSFRASVSCDSPFYIISLHLPLTFCSVAATKLKQLRIIAVLKINSGVQVVFVIFPAILSCETGLESLSLHKLYYKLYSLLIFNVSHFQ